MCPNQNQYFDRFCTYSDIRTVPDSEEDWKCLVWLTTHITLNRGKDIHNSILLLKHKTSVHVGRGMKCNKQQISDSCEYTTK